MRERANFRQWSGIIFALIAILMLSYQPPSANNARGITWLILAISVFVMWGIQAYVMKFSNNSMKAESIFVYMAISALLISPFAIMMTDFSMPINWGFKGPWLAGIIQILNAIGALTLVYAVRYGKAIVVVPMTGLSPVITVIISLIIYSVVPGSILTGGLIVASVAIFLLSE